MVSAAKLAYRPFGLIAGIVSGMIAGAVFKQIWRRVADEDEAPDALQSEYGLGQVVLAAAVQGAIFAAVKALVDRGGAKGFQRLTGDWPGN
jgi:hypothetical protein